MTVPVITAQSALDDLLRRFREAGCEPKVLSQNQHAFTARCPAHRDEHPSLAGAVGRKGIVLKCFAGCSVDRVCAKLGITAGDLFFEQREVAPEARAKAPPAPLEWNEELEGARRRLLGDPSLLRALEARRAWTAGAMVAWRLGIDERGYILVPHFSGAELLTVERFDALGLHDGAKTLAMKGRPRRLLVRPSGVLAREIFVCEGVGDTIAAASAGLCAVGAPSAEIWKPGFAAFLAEKGVHEAHVVGDCDEAGRRFAARASESLREAGIEADVIDLAPHRTDGYDLTDHLRERRS